MLLIRAFRIGSLLTERLGGGWPAEAGKKYLLKSFANFGVDPQDIKTILLTHLHNDHAANTPVFKNARLIFQKDEWKTLLDPLPGMNIRRDYDSNLIEEIKTRDCLRVDGDMEITDGIKIYKTPGHTPGSMSVAVRTKLGVKVMVGDVLFRPGRDIVGTPTDELAKEHNGGLQTISCRRDLLAGLGGSARRPSRAMKRPYEWRET